MFYSLLSQPIVASHSGNRLRGVSLVEVIFSIGVILIGLLGVMSILPLAGNRAQDSISLSVGSTFADSVFQRLKAERFFSNRRLRSIVEVPPASAPPDDIFRTLVLPTNPATRLEPFCIDPLFVSDSGYFTRPIPTAPAAFNRVQFGSYSVRFFPFYTLTHDPTTDPSAPQTMMVTSPVNFSRLTMRRVGISLQGSTVFLDSEQAYHLVESSDDVSFVRPSDRTQSGYIQNLPAVLDSNDLSLQPWQRYGSRIPTGEFTWIATVVPQAGNRFASVSIVVIRKRQRTLLVPERAAQNPQGNATDERLAYVTTATGFSGGAGGVVELVSSDKTVSRLVSGDWLMLSAMSNSGPVHRWYRVSAVDAEPQIVAENANNLFLNATDPALAREIWRRQVYLDGSDFPFPLAPPTNTFATLIEGVVSVTEHTVRMEDF